MSGREVSDEMLMSYVDGELDAGAADAVALAAGKDPALAARLEGFRASREAARGAFSPILGETPPRRLAAAIMAAPGPEGEETSNVVALRPRPRLAQAAAAMAATLVIAAALGGYWWGRDIGGPRDATLLAGDPAIADALSQLATGEASGEVTLLGSYAIEGGTCRAFRLGGETPVRALGCNRGSGWAVEMAVRDAATGGFSPASGGAASSLDAYLDELGASAALAPEEESALRERGWRP